MKKIYLKSSFIKALCLICLTVFVFSFNYKPNNINSWEDNTTIELLEDGGVSGICWLPNGDEVIISTDYGALSKYNVRTKKRLWTKVVTVHHLSVFVADINASGTEMITYAGENAVGADINLVIRSTSDGSVIKTLSEESDYVEKKYANNDPLDLRKTNDPEDLSWQMMPSSARYDGSGGVACVWKNSMETFGMFDHSLVAYNNNYEKIMEWQQVSLNNQGNRNGNMAGIPKPVMLRLDANNYIYGDADCDLYLLDQATIKQGKEKFEISDKTTGPKFFSNPFEENIGVRGLELRGNNLHVMIAGSGYAHYRIYDATTRKPISSNWLELGNEDYFLEVSVTGKYMAVGRSGFRIYNTSTFTKEYDSDFAGGYCFTFNPANDNELAVIKSGNLVLMSRN